MDFPEPWGPDPWRLEPANQIPEEVDAMKQKANSKHNENASNRNIGYCGYIWLLWCWHDVGNTINFKPKQPSNPTNSTVVLFWGNPSQWTSRNRGLCKLFHSFPYAFHTHNTISLTGQVDHVLGIRISTRGQNTRPGNGYKTYPTLRKGTSSSNMPWFFWWFLDILVLRRVYQTSNSFTRNLRSVQKNHVWKTYGVTIPMRQFPRFLVQRFHRFPTEWHQNSRSHPSGYWGCGVNELLQVMLQMWVDLSDLNPNKGKARRRHSRHKPQNKWKRNIYIYMIYVILCVLWTKKLAHAPLSIAQQNTAWPRAADGAILFLRQAGQEKAPTKTIPV